MSGDIETGARSAFFAKSCLGMFGRTVQVIRVKKVGLASSSPSKSDASVPRQLIRLGEGFGIGFASALPIRAKKRLPA